MSSVRDRLSQYQAAAEETAAFGDADAGAGGEQPSGSVQRPKDEQRRKPTREAGGASRRKERNDRARQTRTPTPGRASRPARASAPTPSTASATSASSSPTRSNTPLIIRKAREYEKTVQELRTDQENPASKQKSATATEREDRPRTQTRGGSKSPATAVPNRSNTPLIVRKARDYEQQVKALRADQDTPGIMAKLRQGVTHIEEQTEVPSVTTNSSRPVQSQAQSPVQAQAPPRRNTPLIIRKARDYEQQVKDLRADQEKPGTLARLESMRAGELNFDDDVDEQVESDEDVDVDVDVDDALHRASTGSSAGRKRSEKTLRSNTPLIIRKARDYEQQVRDLRADQENPGLLDKIKSKRNGDLIVEVDDDDEEADGGGGAQTRNPSSTGAGPGSSVWSGSGKALRSNTPLIVRRARDYEQSVKDLLADQEKPGLMQKLKTMRERGDYAQHDDTLQDLAKVPTRRIAAVATTPATPTPPSVTVQKVQNASSPNTSASGSGTPIETSSKDTSSNELDGLLDGDFSEEELPSSSGTLNDDPEDEAVSITGNLAAAVLAEDLPMSAPKLDTFISPAPVGGSKSAHVPKGSRGRGRAHNTSRGSGISAGTGSSFHSEPNLLQTGGSVGLSLPSSEWSDDFDSLTSEDSEGIVLMEELLLGQEFTNDAVLVAEEEELPPGEYLDAARQGDVEADYDTSSSSSGHAKTLSFDSLPDDTPAPDRIRRGGGGSNRPGRRTGGGGAPISSPLPLRRGDTGIPLNVPPSPVSLTVDLEVEEDAGVRDGWRREQSDRLPKAKVVIARRRSDERKGGGGSGREYGRGDELGRTMSASAATRRQLVKQYKDRAELLEGRVSRVDVRASRLTAAQREERARRHAAGVARRSSLVSGAIDRVSMAADPFIDFMADRGGVVPGPKKPRGKLGKLLRRMFKGKKRDRELIKQA